MQHFINAFKLYGVFSGRSTRTEYWMFTLIYLLAYLALTSIAFVLESEMFQITLSILTLGVVIPSLSITARRLHDAGRSGWWQVLPYVGLLFVVIGALQQSQFLMIAAAIFTLSLSIILFFFLVQPSQDDNQYGAAPKL